MSAIYLITPEETLVPLTHQFYESEDLLQTLLEKYPSLLAGDQINPENPRRWLLVKREAAVPGEEDGAGRWSLDHLFLDQDGVPTLVEVKRSTDIRIRREVVGQMLDYAANGVKYWPVADLRAYFEQTCRNAGVDPEEQISELIGGASTQEQFWVTVKTNLQAGRIRMLFVADEIPDELRRVVEFLNEQMDPAEVLAVEIKQFAGETLKTLVPRVIGQTAEADDRKRVSGGRAKRQWDEANYFTEMTSRHGPETTRIARQLLDWANLKATRIWWGQGLQNGSFIPVFNRAGIDHQLFATYTGGIGSRPSVELYFQYWCKKFPFDSRDARLEILRRFNEIPGVTLPEDVIDGRPNISLDKLAPEESLKKFLGIMEWYIGKIVDPNIQ